MRPPANIEPWLDEAGLKWWVRLADSKAQYQRRLAIWWTAAGRSAPAIADLLQTSPRSVRRWIAAFNAGGPAALEDINLGGRRWANLTAADERAVLGALQPRARAGRLVTVTEIRAAVEDRVGHPVSPRSLYDLLHRHDWRKVQPRPRHVKADPAAQEDFKRGSRRSSNG